MCMYIILHVHVLYIQMVIVGSPNITILSPQEIILDRSNCSHLTYYYSKTGTCACVVIACVHMCIQ